MGLVSTAANFLPARNSFNSSARFLPWSVSGMSVRLVCAPLKLHSVSPCRINQSWAIQILRSLYPIRMDFQLSTTYKPQGDQPRAISELCAGINAGEKDQVLLGVTGSGKTFTMAKIIQELNRPALILAHKKTLAAQLYHEFKTFFPNNAVEYFVSYYDYYQPEAYIPAGDLFIEKEATINEELDKLRLSATRSLFERRDAIIVSSVSCIYGLGSPEAYYGMLMLLEKG